MKYPFIVVLVILLGVGYWLLSQSSNQEQADNTASTASDSAELANSQDSQTSERVVISTPDNLPNIIAVEHASAVVEWDEATVFIDPVGDQAQYVQYGSPEIVVITHIHPDHLSTDTLVGMLREDTVVLAPQSVLDEMPAMITSNAATPFAAGTTEEVNGITFTAIPAYNTRPEAQQFHPQERGDIGVVMEVDGTRVYFSGDTEGTPEMRALTNIDTAVVAMNLPYTMGVEAAAEAVAALSPRVVIPYHYRGPDGLSDLDEFARLLQEQAPTVQVERKDWY